MASRFASVTEEQILHFAFVRNKTTGSAHYSAYLVYTKTIITFTRVSVGECVSYLPHRLAAR